MGFGRRWGAALLILLTAACASTDPLGERKRPDSVIRLESEEIAVRTRESVPRLTMQLRLGCEALPCDPREGLLVFVSHRTDETFREEHSITIAAGGIEITYPGPVYGAPQYENRELAEQITVPVSFDDVREIARADSVVGRLGSTHWTIPYERRRSLRSIVRQLGP